jgi:di/tricarboxylate transporter
MSSLHLWITVAVLGAAFLLLVTETLRADLVALLVVVALGVTGVLTPQETFSGFSRSAVITLLGIFILAEGLRRAGVGERAGLVILRLAGHSEARLVVVVMAAGAALSLVMNNIAAGAVLLPGVSAAARRARVSPARLLMPLAFGTLLGGMATLLTTSNIVVSSLLRDSGQRGFGLLDFAPVGLVLVVAGVGYMALVGRNRLPEEIPAERAGVGVEGDLVDIYGLERRLFRARVPPGSRLAEQSLSESYLRETYHLEAVAVEHDGKLVQSPGAKTVLHVGDVLHLQGDLEDFRRIDIEPYLEILPSRDWRERDFESPEIVVVEAVLSPRSGLVGKTLRETHFRARYGMNVLGIWRGGESLLAELPDVKLAFGDALLLQGRRRRLEVLAEETDLIVLPESDAAAEVPVVPSKAGVALVVTAVSLVTAAFFPGALGEIMLGGALVMVLAGVLSMDQAYQAVEWPTIFLVAGMLPMGIALSKTGAAAAASHAFVTLLGSSPLALLAALFALTVVLVQVMSGPALAAVMAPIAITAGQQTGIDPRSLAMGVALATSMAFLSPLGHPVNLLVMGSGGYRFRDYWRVGWPLVLLLFAAVLLVLPRIWPLG